MSEHRLLHYGLNQSPDRPNPNGPETGPRGDAVQTALQLRQDARDALLRVRGTEPVSAAADPLAGREVPKADGDPALEMLIGNYEAKASAVKETLEKVRVLDAAEGDPVAKAAELRTLRVQLQQQITEAKTAWDAIEAYRAGKQIDVLLQKLQGMDARISRDAKPYLDAVRLLELAKTRPLEQAEMAELQAALEGLQKLEADLPARNAYEFTPGLGGGSWKGVGQDYYANQYSITVPRALADSVHVKFTGIGHSQGNPYNGYMNCVTSSYEGLYQGNVRGIDGYQRPAYNFIINRPNKGAENETIYIISPKDHPIEDIRVETAVVIGAGRKTPVVDDAFRAGVSANVKEKPKLDPQAVRDVIDGAGTLLNNAYQGGKSLLNEAVQGGRRLAGTAADLADRFTEAVDKQSYAELTDTVTALRDAKGAANLQTLADKANATLLRMTEAGRAQALLQFQDQEFLGGDPFVSVKFARKIGRFALSGTPDYLSLRAKIADMERVEATGLTTELDAISAAMKTLPSADILEQINARADLSLVSKQGTDFKLIWDRESSRVNVDSYASVIASNYRRSDNAWKSLQNTLAAENVNPELARREADYFLNESRGHEADLAAIPKDSPAEKNLLDAMKEPFAKSRTEHPVRKARAEELARPEVIEKEIEEREAAALMAERLNAAQRSAVEFVTLFESEGATYRAMRHVTPGESVSLLVVRENGADTHVALLSGNLLKDANGANAILSLPEDAWRPVKADAQYKNTHLGLIKTNADAVAKGNPPVLDSEQEDMNSDPNLLVRKAFTMLRPGEQPDAWVVRQLDSMGTVLEKTDAAYGNFVANLQVLYSAINMLQPGSPPGTMQARFLRDVYDTMLLGTEGQPLNAITLPQVLRIIDQKRTAGRYGNVAVPGWPDPALMWLPPPPKAE
jgi:hypothetical protein